MSLWFRLQEFVIEIGLRLAKLVIATLVGAVIYAGASVLGTLVLGRVTDKVLTPAFNGGHVSDSTTYQVDGKADKLSDIKVDAFIVAEGTQRSDGSLDAAAVRAGFGGKIVPNGPSFGKPGFPGGRRGTEGPKHSPAPSTTPG
jgi:hypothetical protein